MVAINKRRTPRADQMTHLNWMGGKSWDISDPVHRLRVAASSCFFGEPMYYHRDGKTRSRVSPVSTGRGLTDVQVKYLASTLNIFDQELASWRALPPADMMEKAIDAALDHDPEATLAEAVRLRTEERMRTTPQVIMVRAALHEKVRGTGLLRTYGHQIIQRADELTVQLAYLRHISGRKTVPNGLKRAWRRAFDGFNEYQLAKYQMKDREVKLVDVMNLCRPKSEAVDKLAKGLLKNTGETWEAIVSAGGSTKETWEKALEKMGHMALLRNLRNLVQKGVDPSRFIPKLIEGAPGGKQLPFRYYSAYKVLEDMAPPALLDAVETCLEGSLDNLPRFPGRVMSLADNSGSATHNLLSSMSSMKTSSVGNLTAVLTGHCSDEGHIGIFGDRLQTLPIRKKSSIFDQLRKADEIGKGIGYGTENGIWLFWDQAIRQAEHWDTVFVYSDMQAGHGGLYGLRPADYSQYAWRGTSYIDVAKLISTYRAKVNPHVKVFLVQIAGYQDTIVPEWYKNTYILGGWGSGLLRFAANMLQLPSQEGQNQA